MNFDPTEIAFTLGGIRLSQLAPLVDGAVPDHAAPEADADGATWPLADGSRFEMRLSGSEIRLSLSGFSGTLRLAALGLRIGSAGNVRQYLRNGYMSWDGSYFVEPEAARDVVAADPLIASGYAATALLPHGADGAVILGFLRHDTYQSRFAFDFAAGGLAIDVETLIDRKPFSGSIEAEPLTLFAADAVEEGLRDWARAVAAASPVPPRLPARRITGWCSWYNLYATLGEPVLLEHLDAAARFRDAHRTPFDVFLVDDGFTPEMGDWLETRAQFPNGIKPVLDAARQRGFTPGLWIAPFMVGNRSRLYAEHPDWVVRSRADGRPLAPMTFYGEFRWHKRSEEYYVLDVTHPEAEAYMRKVFRTWADDWGCGYFKSDFMHLGSIYGADEAVWHQPDLARIEIWMRMIRLIREEIGEALLLCSGAPLWAPIGYADAMRVGRDVGVSWSGHYSAESLLRDQTARNFANGILWQTDPDCILLRERFHELTDDQVRSLAVYAGLAGGLAMTSDQLDEVSPERRDLLAALLADPTPTPCNFPELGRSPLRYTLSTGPTGKPRAVAHADPVLVQKVERPDGSVLVNVFNTAGHAADRLLRWETFGRQVPAPVHEAGTSCPHDAEGIPVTLRPHQSRQFVCSG
jgi:alpha-galactosidase